MCTINICGKLKKKKFIRHTYVYIKSVKYEINSINYFICMKNIVFIILFNSEFLK